MIFGKWKALLAISSHNLCEFFWSSLYFTFKSEIWLTVAQVRNELENELYLWEELLVLLILSDVREALEVLANLKHGHHKFKSLLDIGVIFHQ